MRVYEAVVKGLESLGVEHVFGGPGESNASFLLELKHSTKIRSIIVRNEQAASFMACGYSMYSRRLGVCFATAGPGAFNLISGLAVAMTDSLPVVAITGYSSFRWAGKGALNETTGQGRTPNSQLMFTGTTKKTFMITDPSQTCDILEQAVQLAYEGRPGPVHIHVPANFTHPGIVVPNYREIHLQRVAISPNKNIVLEAARVLTTAISQGKRVMALVGYGTVQSEAKAELLALLERFQIPFATTLNAKGICAEDHPLCLGVLANSGHQEALDFFKGAQVVLAVGNSFSQNATFDFFPNLFLGKFLIHINIDAHEMGKVYQANCAIVADAKLALAELHHQAAKMIGNVPPVQVTKVNNETEVLTPTGSKMHPGQLCQAMSKLLPDDSVVLADAGTHLAWMGHYLRLTKGQIFRKPGSFGPMAVHVHGGMGVKLAHPERTVVVGCGDGCYLLSGFELLTAVQYDIPVVWVVFADGEFNIIKFYQMNAFHESALVSFNNPDYVSFAQACGATGFRAETIDQFEDAFKRALALGKPALIEAVIDPDAVPPFITQI